MMYTKRKVQAKLVDAILMKYEMNQYYYDAKVNSKHGKYCMFGLMYLGMLEVYIAPQSRCKL